MYVVDHVSYAADKLLCHFYRFYADVTTTVSFSFFFLMMRPPPRSTLFPYTPLFRSGHVVDEQAAERELVPVPPVAAAVAHGHRDRQELLLVEVVEREVVRRRLRAAPRPQRENRSEEHTSELQSPDHLVCRLLLEKKN